MHRVGVDRDDLRKHGSYKDVREMSLTVVLPTLNEEAAIAPVVHSILQANLPVRDLRVLVVDDDSEDQTQQVVLRIVERDRRVQLVTRRDRDGLARALEEGVRTARSDVVAWMDADGSMPAATLATMCEAWYQGADLVIGSRYVPGGRSKGLAAGRSKPLGRLSALRASPDSVVAALGGDFLNAVITFMTGSAVRDHTSGYVMCTPGTALALGFQGQHGEYCIRMIARAQRAGLAVVEVPYAIELRKGGKSKTGASFWGLLRTGIWYLSAATYAVVIRWLHPRDQWFGR